MKTPMLLIGLHVGIALTCMTTTPVQAVEEGHQHKHEETSQNDDSTLPESIEGIMTEIHEQHTMLSEIVTKRQLDKVHYHAFAIRDLAQKLPAKVNADKSVRVEGTVNNIAKLAEELDASGDSGNQAATEANLKKLNGLLKVLEAQFQHQQD